MNGRKCIATNTLVPLNCLNFVPKVHRFYLLTVSELFRSEMSCAKTVCRHSFWLFNALCMITGVVTALICAIFMASIHSAHLLSCILGFGLGLATFLVALLGWRALKPESMRLMWCYAALLSVVLVAQLCITMHYHTRNVVNEAVEEVKLLWAEELKRTGPMATIEREFKCCGLDDYKDYVTAGLAVPASCCDYSSGSVVYYSDGCLEKVKFAACRGASGLRIISTILTVVQICALALACLLAIIFHRNIGYDII